MDSKSLSETATRRAINDTISAQKTVRFTWVGDIVLAGAGGAWLTVIAPALSSNVEIVMRAVIGGLGGLLTATILIFVWNLFKAPYRQRNEARERILELETGKANIFDAQWRHRSIIILVAKRENGEWIGDSGSTGPAPLTLTNKKELLTITKLELAPSISFVHKSGWCSTNAIELQPQVLVLPATQTTTIGLEWDMSDPLLWELKGLPITVAKDDSIILPQFMLRVADAAEFGAHYDKEEPCKLVVRLMIRTDRGSQDIPELSLELNPQPNAHFIEQMLGYTERASD